MTETKLAKAPWPKVKQPRSYNQKPVSRIDAKFEEWAKRNGVNLKDIKLMEKR